MNLLQSYSPIGKFIFLTFKNPNALNDDDVLKNNLENLVRSLKDNIKTYGINDAQRRMEDTLFSLRFEILEYLKYHPDLLDNIESIIIQQIGEKYFISGKFKELGNAVSDTLEIYLLMFGQLIKDNISSFGSISDDINAIKSQITSLSSLRRINELQPNPELNIVIEFFSASVRYDFFLIAAEFIINNEITIEENKLYHLATSLKKSIVDFGVYTLLSGLWQPNPDEESQLIRNIKIKAAAYKMNAGLGKSISLHNLQNLLLS